MFTSRYPTTPRAGPSVTEEAIVKLNPERKHLTNLIKLVAYQAENELFRRVATYHHRVEDETAR